MAIDRLVPNAPPACILYVELAPVELWIPDLESAGYRLISLAGGDVSVERVKQANPDLILLASEPDGSACCRLLAMDDQTRDVPVVLVGDNPSSDEQVQGIRAGALDVLSVDMDRGLLLAKVRSLIKRTIYANELDHRQIMMLQAQKLAAVGRLASCLAHEINSPLQVVRDNLGFVQDSASDLLLLQSHQAALRAAAECNGVASELVAVVDEAVGKADLDYLRAELPSALSQSFEAVEQMAEFVRLLKEVTRSPTARPVCSNLNATLEIVLRVARSRWVTVVNFETDFDPELPLVPCFVSDLNQVVLNIIDNACEAVVAHPGGGRKTVHLATRGGEREIQIIIRDSGCGIDPGIRSSIFNPFFTTKTSVLGAGQGLAIAWSVIVDQHHGAIDVDPVMPSGSCFTLTLPLDGVECR